MKKIRTTLLSLFLAASCVGGLAACNNDNESNEGDGGEQGDTTPKEINFLAIGNSHTLDTTMYLVDIAKVLGIKVNLTTMVIGGCTLDYHYETAATDKFAYEYRTNGGSDWENLKSPCRLSEAVKACEWDYIMIQSYSKVAGFEDSYTKLDAYLDILRGKASGNPKFIWNMTWAYQSDYRDNIDLNSGDQGFDMYEYNQINQYTMIADSVKKIIAPRDDIVSVVASGTAIQNARTSYLGDTMTHDGLHLNAYGRFIAGMTLIKSVTGVSIDNINYVPELMDAQKKAVAIESANNAVKTPFAVTQSNYKN